MKITVFDCKLKPDAPVIYYPQYQTTWLIAYRSVFGWKKEKMTLMTDRLKSGSSMVDQLPAIATKEVADTLVMGGNLDVQRCLDEAHETIRRHYLHRVRSWSVPDITLSDHFYVYTPYQLTEKTSGWRKKTLHYLYEPMTHSSARLSKFPEIYSYIKKEGSSL